MKVLLGCVLIIVLSGCVPIGIQGRTSAIDAPAPLAAAQSTPGHPAAAARGVSVGPLASFAAPSG